MKRTSEQTNEITNNNDIQMSKTRFSKREVAQMRASAGRYKPKPLQRTADYTSLTKRRKRIKQAKTGMSVARTQAPVALGSVIKHEMGVSGNLAFKYKEAVGTVTGTSDYSIKNYRVNVADMSTFPFLSQLARNFAQYKIRNLAFRVIPQCPSITTGQIYMCYSYDSSITTIDSLHSFQMNENTTCNSWIGAAHQYRPPKEAVKMYYIAAEPTTDVSETRQNDAAMFHIATQGQTEGQPIAQLWVEYDIELVRPVPSVADLEGFVAFECGGSTAYQDTWSIIQNLPEIVFSGNPAFVPQGPVLFNYGCKIAGRYAIYIEANCANYLPSTDDSPNDLPARMALGYKGLRVGRALDRPIDVGTSLDSAGAAVFAVIDFNVGDTFNIQCLPSAAYVEWETARVNIIGVGDTIPVYSPVVNVQ